VIDLETFRQESQSDFPTNKKLKDRLRRLKPKDLDLRFAENHEEGISRNRLFGLR